MQVPPHGSLLCAAPELLGASHCAGCMPYPHQARTRCLGSHAVPHGHAKAAAPRAAESPALRAQDARMFFAQTLLRVATPVREVSWADFLLADVLTSLSKALSDLERASCHLLTGPIMAPQGPEQARL